MTKPEMDGRCLPNRGQRAARGSQRRARRVAIVFAVASGVAGCDAPMWRAAWPKPEPVKAKRCAEGHATDEVRKLAVDAELDYDDGHVKRWMLVYRAAPKNTPETPELAKVGDCYSDAVDLSPHAKGKVVVEYDPGERGADVCLIQSAIDDGAFVACVMKGIRSIPPSWFPDPRATSVVSIDFRPRTEAAYREWYGTGEMRWDGNQAPRMKDVPESD
jgi:hypothetical protein